jgi:hypothetical protein
MLVSKRDILPQVDWGLGGVAVLDGSVVFFWATTAGCSRIQREPQRGRVGLVYFALAAMLRVHVPSFFFVVIKLFAAKLD